MNILFRNSTDFWVPSYVFNDSSYLSWWNVPYYLLIFVTMFTCFWMCFFMMRVVCEVRKFHGNATYLLASMYAAWFECFLGTAIILPYKYGLVQLAEPGRIFEGFEDTSNYLRIDDISWKLIPILIASFLQWHYLGIINSGFFCFLMERTWATVLVSDYESKNRRYLSIFLVLFHQIYALVIAFSSFFHLIPLKHQLRMNATGLLWIIPYLLILRYYNMKKRKNMKLAKSLTKNSLAAKFQTEENVRSISLAFRIFTITIVFNVVFLVMILLGIAKLPGAQYFSQIAENILFFNPIFVVPAVLSSEKDWRNRFLHYIPLSRLRIHPEKIQSPSSTSESREAEAAETTEMHFMQLQNQWV